MDFKEIITNVHVYGMDDAIIGSKYPMAVDLSKPTADITKTTLVLAQCETGTGHDQFLTGITVNFDLTFTNKAWVEAERYRFLYFVSSQSTMHRMAKFDYDNSYIEYVDPRMIEIMKEKLNVYNMMLKIRDDAKANGAPEKTLIENEEAVKRAYLELLYSNPAGFKITAKMTTNYRQLKTIYQQRRTHRLPEWQAFCDWIETLPHAEFITGNRE
jgi:hypothetical protein